MSRSQENTEGLQIKLLPHQLVVVELFFDPTSKRVMELKWDVGLGKITVILALSERLLKDQPNARVLFLGPKALQLQITQKFRGSGVKCEPVDRYRFREMLDSTRKTGFWPTGQATIMSTPFAIQEDIMNSLQDTQWDLVVFMETHTFRGKRGLKLLQKVCASANRIIFETIPGLKSPDIFKTNEITVLEKRRGQISDNDDLPLDVPHALNEIPFSLTHPELSIFEKVKDLCDLKILNPFIEKQLYRSLESSHIKLEETFRKIRNSFAHHPVGEKIIETNANLTSVLFGKVMHLTNNALHDIESIEKDSKLDAFAELLNSLVARKNPPRKICVLTMFHRTARYLSAEIESMCITHQLLHGSCSFEERYRRMKLFSSNTEDVLIATMAGVEGWDPSDLTDLVVYDCSYNPIRVKEILGRFNRLGRQNPLNVYIFRKANCNIGEDFERVRDIFQSRNIPESVLAEYLDKNIDYLDD
jgi:ERCC4-related helicase